VSDDSRPDRRPKGGAGVSGRGRRPRTDGKPARSQERVEAEPRLVSWEARFGTALAGMLDGYSILEAVRENGAIVDFRAVWVNDAICRMFRVAREELIGRPLLELFPEMRGNGVFAEYVRVVETGQPMARDSVPYPGSDGRSRVMDIRATKLDDGSAVTLRDVTERQQAQEDVFRTEQMLQLVLDTIPQRVFWKDTHSTFVGCNAPLARDAGFDDPSQLVGLTDHDMSWKPTADRYQADDREVMETGVAKIDYEEPQVRSDGSEGWLQTSKLPLRAGDGRIVGVLGTYEDITDRKRAEEALRRSEKFLDSIVENIPDMIFVKDAGDLRFVRFNRAGERLLGRARDELVGKTDHDIHPKDEADFFTAKDREVLETALAIDIPEEDHSIGPLGHRTLHTKKIPILDDAGKPTYLLGISEDITDRKRAEEALRRSEERYRHIIETITDYVFTVVVKGGEVASTTHGPGSLAVTGYTSEELSSDPLLWLGIVVPSDRAFVVEQSRRVLAGELVEPLEHRIVRKDGALRWVRSTLVSRFDASGALVAYDALIQDVTERRALREQLLQAQKMEGIGRLAGGVAHDFNNLLTAILGYVEMARLELPADLAVDHPIRADLDEIGAAGERAASLTRQLLTFASKQIVAPVRLDLSTLIADLLKMMRPLLGENIAVETDLEAAIGTIEADPSQIQQLLVNLTVNARDAMPEGGRLIIETATENVTEAIAATQPGARSGSHVRLSVTDTGCGMSPEVRSHLFEPFFTTKGPGKGTGLGLATCHGIVRQMGGHIRVFSEPGNGTTFRIFLPCVGGPATARAADNPIPPDPTGTETVLVVEDEPVVRRLAVLGLRAQGYTVIEACDGFEALEIAGRIGTALDIVVSDVIMPGISGPELVRRLAAVTPGTKRLLVSGHAESSVLPAGLIDAGTAFLSKPFTPERLARKVREVLDAPALGCRGAPGLGATTA
jgi:two-component system cell cycle sensor histidine kinase/response regulator CckA